MRLVGAEFLKHYRRTGFVLATFGVTVLPALMMQALDDARYEDLFGVLALLVVVAGIMVGSSLGTSDESSGVFRELVATGRPRLDLFAARVPAGLVLVLACAMAGYVVLAAGEGLVLAHAGWLALVAAVSFALSLGVAALVGSAAQSIASLLALWLVVTPLVQNAQSLDWLRDCLVLTGLDRLMPASLNEGTPLHYISATAAIAVLLAWTVVPLLAGAWRTMTRDA